jgi:hypothetical protein
VGVEYKKIENDVKTRWCVHMCVCVCVRARARACARARPRVCVRRRVLTRVSYLTQTSNIHRWSTYVMCESLIDLKRAINTISGQPGGPNLLSQLDWWVIEVGKEVLRPFVMAQSHLRLVNNEDTAQAAGKRHGLSFCTC